MNDIKHITQLDALMEELDGGALAQRIALALADTAMGVAAVGEKKKRGKVVVTFDIGLIGSSDSSQVQIDHTVEMKAPTHRGRKSEQHTTSSVLYVGMRGKLTAMPNKNKDMFEEPAAQDNITNIGRASAQGA